MADTEDWIACKTGDCPHQTQAECDAWLHGYRTASDPAVEPRSSGEREAEYRRLALALENAAWEVGNGREASREVLPPARRALDAFVLPLLRQREPPTVEEIRNLHEEWAEDYAIHGNSPRKAFEAGYRAALSREKP